MNLPAPDNIKDHSRTGIASFIIGVLSLIGFVIFIIYELNTLNSSFDPDTIIEVIFGSIAASIVFVMVLCTGFITGIISLFQKDTKKLFGILGVLTAVLNVIILAIMILLVSVSGATF